jgi:thiamine kinase-like enzyme
MTSFEKNFLVNNEKNIELSENEKKELLDKGINQDDFYKLLSNKYNKGCNAFTFLLEEKDIIAKKNINNSSVEHEYAILKLLDNKKFNHSPAPIYFIKKPSILLEKEINGVSIDFSFDINIKKIASVLAELHSISFKKFGKPEEVRKKGDKLDNLKFNLNLLENHWQKIKLNKNSDDNYDVNSVLNYLSNFNDHIDELRGSFSEKNFSLIHFDLHKDNILLDKNNKVFIIDWGNSSIGDNAMDIAKLFYKNNFFEKQKLIFFQNYVFFDETIKKRVEVYYPLVVLNSLAWRLDMLTSKYDVVDDRFLELINKDWEFFNNFNKL